MLLIARKSRKRIRYFSTRSKSDDLYGQRLILSKRNISSKKQRDSEIYEIHSKNKLKNVIDSLSARLPSEENKNGQLHLYQHAL